MGQDVTVEDLGLSGVKLNDATMRNMNVENMGAAKVNLDTMDVANVNAKGIKMSDVDAQDLSVRNAGVSALSLADIKARDAEAHNLQVSNVTMQDSKLSNIGMSKIIAEGMTLNQVVASNIALQKATLSDLDVSHVQTDDLKVHGLDLNGSAAMQTVKLDNFVLGDVQVGPVQHLGSEIQQYMLAVKIILVFVLLISTLFTCHLGFVVIRDIKRWAKAQPDVEKEQKEAMLLCEALMHKISDQGIGRFSSS